MYKYISAKVPENKRISLNKREFVSKLLSRFSNQIKRFMTS